MGRRFSQEFIDSLIARVDIVSVIDKRVPLKKSGKEYRACCPFHSEKSPSFFVSPQKQFYHCFGCGAHGTAIGFLMQYDRLGFNEAVHDLARDAGVPIPDESGRKYNGPPPNTGIYEILERTTKYYRQQLRVHIERESAISYLKSRGVSGEIAVEFEIGFAPSGWQNLEHGIGATVAEKNTLLDAGMLIKNDAGRTYDRFRQRIMFPIRDRRGRVIGFGGRIINDGQPKYLNSPETEVFHKGKELYGLFQARKTGQELIRIIVVEGYMDVVMLAQYGIKNVVATLGTAVTEHHIKELVRHTQEIVFCFDGDRAGRQAAWRALETSIELQHDGLQFRFLFLPDGEDPDTLVRKIGKLDFEKKVENAVSLPDFLFESLSSKADIRREDGQARLIHLFSPFIEKMPPGALRTMLLNRLAALAQIDPNRISAMIGRNLPGRLAVKQAPATVTRDRFEMPTLTRRAIALLVLKPSLADFAGSLTRFQHVQVPGAALLQEILVFLRQSPHLNTTGSILEHWRDRREGEFLSRLVAEEWQVPDDGMEIEFSDALSRIEAQGFEQQVDNLLLKARHNGLSDDEKELLNRLLRAGKSMISENNS